MRLAHTAWIVIVAALAVLGGTRTVEVGWDPNNALAGFKWWTAPVGSTNWALAATTPATNRYTFTVTSAVQVAVTSWNGLGESPRSAPILLLPVLTSDVLADALPRSNTVPVAVQLPDATTLTVAGVLPLVSNGVPSSFVIVVVTNLP